MSEKISLDSSVLKYKIPQIVTLTRFFYSHNGFKKEKTLIIYLTISVF